MQIEKPLPKHVGKCPAHNFWMKRGQCELCRMDREKQQKELEARIGFLHPTVKIGKLFDK